ncbi:MAG: D-ornithine 4,5-aminomutase subunit OraE, partial [Planctomycetota bacterium]
MKLNPEQKIDVEEVLRDLDQYRPKRKGWSWRQKIENQQIGPFEYRNSSGNLKRSVPLAGAHFFENIDPQCDMVITTEVASGRFEDDLRRMR